MFQKYTSKYAWFKIRQILQTKIRHISKYEYGHPKYDWTKVKYAHICVQPTALVAANDNYDYLFLFDCLKPGGLYKKLSYTNYSNCT